MIAFFDRLIGKLHFTPGVQTPCRSLQTIHEVQVALNRALLDVLDASLSFVRKSLQSIWMLEILPFTKWRARDRVSREKFQIYYRNTPIPISRYTDVSGSASDVIASCTRVQRRNRIYRPVALTRIVPLASGSLRIRVRLRPTSVLGWPYPAQTCGSKHIHHVRSALNLRPTTTAPIRLVDEERPNSVEQWLHLFLEIGEHTQLTIQAEG